MALIALTSASGAPGVSTTALGMALKWPRPALLVEADPTGGAGVLAGYLRGTRPYLRGLIELALTASTIEDGLAEVVEQIEGTEVSFVAGTRTHAQATALRDLWAPLADALVALEAHGQDVVVDAGRLGMIGSPGPLLAAADVVLLVVRTDLPSISAARSWTETVVRGDLGWQHAGVLVVGEGNPYSSREVTRALGLPAVASIDWDPAGAAVLHRGAPPPKRFDTSAYVRSLTASVASVHSTVAQRRSELGHDLVDPAEAVGVEGALP